MRQVDFARRNLVDRRFQTSAWRAEAGGIDTVFVQLRRKRRGAKAEALRGTAVASDPAPALRERLLDRRGFYLVETAGQRAAAGYFSRRGLTVRRDHELVSGRENHAAFDDIFQLAYVSRPGVLERAAHRRLCDALHRLSEPAAQDCGEVLEQYGDIFGAVPKRRNVNGKDVE